jgi:hypothetical protein
MTAVEAVARVIAAFEKLQIPYMTVGSLSSNAYGHPRSTKDADFVIELGDRPIAAFMSELGPGFHLDAQMSFGTITGTMRYRLWHNDTAFMIELFLLSNDAHDQSRFARRVVKNVDGTPAALPTPEDVVITKLRWSKHGKRKKDVDDALAVLAKRATCWSRCFWKRRSFRAYPNKFWTIEGNAKCLFESSLPAQAGLSGRRLWRNCFLGGWRCGRWSTADHCRRRTTLRPSAPRCLTRPRWPRGWRRAMP